MKKLSADRYDNILSKNPEMVHNKLLSRIKDGSKVLEFGPASGIMTRELKKKQCYINIVEIDKQCFEKVMEIADDGICDDIENYQWVKYLAGKKYDYILFSDVLEHLKKPEETLEVCKDFLRVGGVILISLPNIAHNSVILSLMENRFIYHETGILDITHIRHFTFLEAKKMIEECGYSIKYCDGAYVSVGKNEFPADYEDIPVDFAEYLKKRPFGELYQFLFEIQLGEATGEVDDRLGKNTEYMDLDILQEEEEKFPSVEYSENYEIARLRLEINELFNMYPELKKAKDNQEELNELKQHLKELDGQISKKDERIVQLQGEVEERNEHLKVLDKEIEEKNLYINRLQTENRNEIAKMRVEELEREKEILQECMGEVKRDKEELRREKEILQECLGEVKRDKEELRRDKRELQERLEKSGRDKEELQERLEKSERDKEELQRRIEGIEHCKKELEEEKEQIARECEEKLKNLEQLLSNKKGHIELLLESDRELERIKNSSAYRKALKHAKMKAAILPQGSRRYIIVKLVQKFLRHPFKFLKVLSPTRVKNFLKYLKRNDSETGLRRVEETMQGNAVPPIVIQTESVDTNGNKSIDEYEKLCFTRYEKPEVSIVIPVYNQFDYTYNCLKSILNHTEDVTYEIIIANDCSTDLTVQLDKVTENITIINNKENLRFLKNCNNAAKSAKGKYILFLNNDTQVQQNWLRPLVELIESSDDIGMVGSKLVYANGKLQEAGGIFWKDASAWNYGHLQNPEDPEYNYVKEVDYISGAAIMIRKSLWTEIGGFDEQFAPAYYEDSDLAFEVRRHGYKVVYQPLSVVVHFEGVSNGTDVTTGQKAYQVVNQQKFYEKWKDVLELEHFPNGENVFLAKDRSRNKKQILVVDHYVPHYDKDAGGKCTYMYLLLFVKMGFKVTFIGDNFYKHEPYTTDLNQHGIEVLYGNYYYNNWEEWLKNNLHYFDYVYLQRPHISIKYIDMVKKYGHAKVFYFAHDLHHVREYREYMLTHDKEKLKSSEHWKKIEYELFSKADVGHVVGSYEQGVMQEAFPNKPIRNIPLYIYEDIPTDIDKNFEKRHDLIYVGGFGHPPNVDAVLWFAKEVYPKVLERYPDMKWHVVGGKVPQEIQDLANENIIIEGFLSDEELHKLYCQCRIAVVPLRVGAGVKGKVVEAAYYQIPLVTTTIGAEGLDDTLGNMVVEDDAAKMADSICDLYVDYDILQKMSDASLEFIKKYFVESEAKRILLLDMNNDLEGII